MYSRDCSGRHHLNDIHSHLNGIHCITSIPGVYGSYSMCIEYKVSYTSVHSKHLPDFSSPTVVPLKAYSNSYMHVNKLGVCIHNMNNPPGGFLSPILVP